MVGKTIGKFKVLSEIGRGGMGVVYKALQISLNRTVALKLLPSQMALSSEFLERFQREARILARLNHKNIVHIYDLEDYQGACFIVMEYIEGESLAKVIERRAPLPTGFIKRIGLGVASALSAAHQAGIIHRDIKPENIMIDAYDEVKVMDFGIARAADQACKTRSGIRLGTPEYMSPEQAKGLAVEASSDIYSLGIVLYEMACRKVPFTGEDSIGIALKHIQEAPEPPSQRNSRIHPELERIILKALEKDKSSRFGDAAELARALEKIPATEEEEPAKERPLKFMFCPSCGASLEEDFLRCPGCGLVVRRQCPYCLEIFDAIFNVCPHCSKELPQLQPESIPKTILKPASSGEALAAKSGEDVVSSPDQVIPAKVPLKEAVEKAPGIFAKPRNLFFLAAGLLAVVAVALVLSSGNKKSRPPIVSSSAGKTGGAGSVSPPAPAPGSAQLQAGAEKTETPPSLNELNEMIGKARDYFDRGAYDLCISQAEEILKWSPDQKEARALVQRATEAKPVVALYLAAARKALNETRYRDCLAECRKIIALSSKHPQAQELLNLAEAQVQAAGSTAATEKRKASSAEDTTAAEQSRIRALVERQRRAMETEDIPLLLRDVVPELQPQIRADAEAFFAQNQVLRVAFTNIGVRVTGAEAEVSLTSAISYIPAGTDVAKDLSSAVNWRLKKIGTEWKIVKF